MKGFERMEGKAMVRLRTVYLHSIEGEVGMDLRLSKQMRTTKKGVTNEGYALYSHVVPKGRLELPRGYPH